MSKKSAAGRFVQQTIKWTELEKLVIPEERPKYLAFKGKSESYLRRVLSNPEAPPPINWAEYKKLILDEKIVSNLQSEYEKFKVPYPSDPLSAEVDKQWEELQPKIKSFCEEQQKAMNVAKSELDRINSLPPFETITMEMFHDMYPELALKPVERPTFWPHTEDEQLGYVDPQAEKH